jgi:iron(III) transport system permease protein
MQRSSSRRRPPGPAARSAASFDGLLGYILVALLAVLVLAPVFAVAWAALLDASTGGGRAVLSVLGSTRIIGNTLYVALLATVVSVVIGAMLALAIVRVEVPSHRLLNSLIPLPIYVAPLLTAIAWSWLGSPRAGFLNILWRDGLGLGKRIVNLHTPEGIVFVAALAYAPLPFLLVGGALRGMDPALEDSARVQGAAGMSVFLRITLPLMLPAVLGSSILVLVQCMGLFSVPAVLGMPGGYYVAGTEIYRLINNYPPRIAQAATWGLLLLIATSGLLVLQTALLGRRSFATITGKAFRPRPVPLGLPARLGLTALAWGYVLAAVGLPVIALVWASLVNFVTADVRLMTFDLKNFAYVLFEYPKTALAFENSAVLATGTASLVCGLGLAIGWMLVRSRSSLSGILEHMSMMPLAIPSMALALGVLWTWVGVKFLPVYGTILILLLAYTAHYIPFGVRASAAALRQLHPELEDAARLSGATWLQTFTRVVAPLTAPTLMAVWTLIFVLALQEVNASILLYTSRTVVLSVAVFDLWEAGNLSALAALSVIQLVITFLILALVRRLSPGGALA